MKKLLFLLILISTNVLANESSIVNTAKNDLLDKLKDPDSAKFYDVKVITNSQGKKAVCGMVNSKNSYGGYVGKKSFFSYEAYTNIVNLDDSINTHYYKLSGCAGVQFEKDAIYEELAMDGCLSSWDLIENTFIRNYPEEKSIDIAISNVKTKASMNHKNVTSETIQNLKNQYSLMLKQASSNPNFLADIKSTATTTDVKKGSFLSTCIPNTMAMFKKNGSN